MKRFKRILSLVLCAAALTAGAGSVSAGAAAPETVRVGLTVSGQSAFASPMLENASGAGYTFGTMSGTTFSGSTKVANTQLTIKLVNDAFQVQDTGTGAVLYTTAAGADHLAIHPAGELTWFKGYKWRGDFVYRRASGGDITVINYVGLEDYVKGVLPYEIDPDWPIEAQKAQALCTRSFAVGTHKHTEQGYDLCNTTNCQVYLGANRATDASDRAVDETRGETLSYNGEQVIGYFYSSDGGATEDAANVWGGDYPYLKGKEDPYEDTSKDAWSVTLTADEIRQKLQNAGYSIGTIANVEVTKRTDVGNVNEVTVTDTTGKQVTIARANTRTVFGLKSIRYEIIPSGASAQSTSLNVKTAPSPHKVTVDGKSVAPQGYYITRNGNQYGNNYYKLRDIACILSGTDAQFNVTWDGPANRIVLTPGAAYQTVGGELTRADDMTIKSLYDSNATIVLGNKTLSLTGYLINGSNYYLLRDVADTLGFSVDYDNASETVLIESGEDSSKDPEDGDNTNNNGNNNSNNNNQTTTAPTSYTFKGTGWGHSVGMSQWGAYAMAQKGFDYEDILKFYFTGIEIAR